MVIRLPGAWEMEGGDGDAVGLLHLAGRTARLEKAGGGLSLLPLLRLPSQLPIPSGILTAFWGQGSR